MPPDKLHAAIASWKRDALRRGVAKLYGAKGFLVDDSGGLPEPIAFLSRANEQSQDSIAVGCISAGGTTAPTTEVQLFWQRMQERQLKSGVIVTNGNFEPAALEFASSRSLLMVDAQGLAQAITEIPEQQRLTLFQAPTQPVTVAAPVAAKSPSPSAAPKTERPTAQPQFAQQRQVTADVPSPAAAPSTPPPQITERPQTQTGTPSQMLGAPVGVGQKSQSPSPANPGPTPTPEPPAAADEPTSVPQPEPSQAIPAATSAAAGKISWKPSFAAKRLPEFFRRFGVAAILLALIAVGGYAAFQSDTARAKITSLAETIWQAGPFGSPTGESEPTQQIQINEPSENAEYTPIEPPQSNTNLQPPKEALDHAKRMLVHRVALLDEIKNKIWREQCASAAVTVDQLGLEHGVDFVKLSRGDLMNALGIMYYPNTSPEALPAEFLGNPHFVRLREHRMEEIYQLLTIDGNGRIELDTEEVDLDARLSNGKSIGESDPNLAEASLHQLDRRLYVHSALESRRRAQSIAGVVGSASAAGIDFVGANTNVHDVIQAALQGAVVDDQASAFHGVEFRVPSAFAEPLEQIVNFLDLQNGRLVYHEEINSDVEVEQRFGGRESLDLKTLKEAQEAAEGLIRAANMELLVQRELKLDRLLAPVTGLSPAARRN